MVVHPDGGLLGTVVAPLILNKMSKHKFKGVVDKLEYMAHRMKGLQETRHFGAKRRARHKGAQRMHDRIAKGEDIF